MKHQKFLMLVSIILIFAALTGCGAMPQIELLDGADREAVLAYAEPMADNIFQAINEKDYARFSKDFDAQMAKALNEKSFNDLLGAVSKLGAYQSRVVEKVERIDTLDTITYTARFENEEAVSVRLTLRPGETPMVAGLWLDSPKLREK